MSAGCVNPDSSGFPVRWLGGFAVVELPAGRDFPTPAALAGELCAVLDAGAAGLIADLPNTGVGDSACLDALMRAARRARGWGSWLRLVIPDPGVRRVVRLLAALTALVAAGTPHLVVDLSGLAYLDCSCVQVLWRAFRMAQEAGGTLGLAAPQPLVARVMELWGADQVVGVHDSVTEAAIAAGQKRGSRPAATEPPAERGAGGRPGAAAVDGFLPRVAHGDAAAFAGVYDQVAGAVYGLVLRIVGDQSRAGLRPSAAAGVIAERAAGSLLEHRGLASLPGPQREAVLLACCGYTWRQAADLAGVPAGTVAGRLREGLLGLGSRPRSPVPRRRGQDGRPPWPPSRKPPPTAPSRLRRDAPTPARHVNVKNKDKGATRCAH
jgi:anti-anti-sigma factor